jgi:hypothetical protein
MPEIKWLSKSVGTIDDLLTSEACDEFVRFSEARRYEEAPITTDRGAVIMKDIRNNDRVMVDDVNLANQFFGLLVDLLPPRFQKKWRPVGLNERIRFYRYDEGQLFDWHRDDYYERPNGERSFFTFMIYLNDDFEGGGTSFHEDGVRRLGLRPFTVTPKKGMGLLFHHPIVHRGDTVEAGRKYVVRTDVMYERALRSVS